MLRLSGGLALAVAAVHFAAAAQQSVPAGNPLAAPLVPPPPPRSAPPATLVDPSRDPLAEPILPPSPSPPSPPPATLADPSRDPLTQPVVPPPPAPRSIAPATLADPSRDPLIDLVVPPSPSPESVPPATLAEPSRDPLGVDDATDPILELVSDTSSPEMFMRLVEGAVAYNPAIAEARAGEAEAEAAQDEARSYLFPTLDLSLSGRRSITRNFSDDADNIVERSRSLGRTDATFVLRQRVLDFGATSMRIRAGGDRLRAASHEIDRQADQLALNAIGAWYDVFTYRALVQLGEAFELSQDELRAAVDERIELGVSAEGDRAQVESYIASAAARLAGYRRELANAEARFQTFFDVPPPPGLVRAPLIGGRIASADMARAAALNSPVVRLVEEQAEAARHDARAARADTYPQVSVGIEGGRFGLFENPDDYDVRATVNVTARLGGPGDALADQNEARADGQRARADRIRDDAEREAAIAWTDFAAIEGQLAALRQSYLASRRSRDVLLERFRVARGTLFDVLESEDSYFQTAAQYIVTVSELDAAHYVLLSRTGRLLGTLDIDPTPAWGTE